MENGGALLAADGAALPAHDAEIQPAAVAPKASLASAICNLGNTILGAGILGNLFGGIGSDYFLRRTGIGRPMFMFWVSLLIMPMMILFIFDFKKSNQAIYPNCPY